MSDARSIKDQYFVYHLTSIENLDGIFSAGLKPRASLANFTDVADSEILKKRKALNLDRYVPFHWFAGNPFDGRVQLDHPKSKFVLISVFRTFAKEKGWKIIPQHPLTDEAIQLLDYSAGFQAINWELMNTREYQNHECKNVCMAECLSPHVVSPENFSRIYVPNDEVKQLCEAKMRPANLATPISVNPGMFL
ncbi:DarT ssDNA thymidine ADP-ribosyltransferase family protein [Pseudomonas brassicacearum]|uniref:DarT ssDNA thymidine ADP-ribosyltransferase family protein n=1 Tax=Pseudomonas brassicacearum TaxID=930166 RepID=UPI002733C1B2|nr:DarT ssDNA thymidine ADP-ribosyltransferase family protein [Pseudomonas brassicacearum]WLG67524.1 DarT ssDNA thymidine ADP-ribosyltransferase family protein [Pseudomonas brassicacearum]